MIMKFTELMKGSVTQGTSIRYRETTKKVASFPMARQNAAL